MAANNSTVSMEGDFKRVYKKAGLVNAIPNWAILQKKFPFDAGDSNGEAYVFGVTLQRENGFSYQATFGADQVAAAAPNAPVAGYIGKAIVQSFGIYLRSRLDYAAAVRASARGPKAFEQAYAALLKNMKESHVYRLELSLLYGQDGLGVVQTSVGGGVFQITEASWASGIWVAGLKGAILEAFTGVTATETQHNGDLVISSVDASLRRITVTGTSSAVAPGDVFYFKQARTTTAYNECVGLHKILTNTGTLFGIDAASQELWKAQTYPVNGQISLTAIFQGASLGLNFGLTKGLMLLNPNKFAQLASDEAALRRYVQDVSDSKRGVKGISFQMGEVDIEVVVHPFIKQGEGMLLAEDTIIRTGGTEITSMIPGSGDTMNVNVIDQFSIELRSMSDQAILSEKPAPNVMFTAISA